MDTFGLDSQLYQLASYDVTKGRIIFCDTAEMEDEFKKKVIQKFNHFKDRIQDGEYTFVQLRDYILSKYGPYKQTKLTEEQELNELEKIANTPMRDDDDGEDFLLPPPQSETSYNTDFMKTISNILDSLKIPPSASQDPFNIPLPNSNTANNEPLNPEKETKKNSGKKRNTKKNNDIYRYLTKGEENDKNKKDNDEDDDDKESKGKGAKIH